jgi:AcrR family transcriptional regulator
MNTKRMNPDEMRVRILETAEALLRRHGPEKLTVIDVASALNMSHGNVYRHFSSKAALRAAVVAAWLDRIAAETGSIAGKDAPADVRLEEWLKGLARIKQRKVIDDVEMLSASAKIGKEAPEVEHEHSARLISQVERILNDGLEEGSLPGAHDPKSTARAILNATFRYHHPDLVATGGPPAQQSAALDDVIALIIGGLKRP